MSLKPGIEGHKKAAWMVERWRSRFRLGLFVVTLIVVPTAVTVLFIGNERAQGYAILVLALLIVVIGFLPLFQRPLSKSLQSPAGPASNGSGGFHGY